MFVELNKKGNKSTLMKRFDLHLIVSFCAVLIGFQPPRTLKFPTPITLPLTS